VFSQKYIDEHDVVERYLADQLSETEREGFEAYFMEHPEVVQQMNRTARFKSALLDLNDSGRLQPLLVRKPQRTRAIVITAVAAVLVGLIILVATLWRRSG
jgi:hypothetical protein